MKKKGLQITNDHGWTIERLQEQERAMKKANMAKRIAVIRLIMQGYLGIQAAELLNLHRETVSIYVQKFNQGGMEALLEHRYAPGQKAVSVSGRRTRMKKDAGRKHSCR
ncbi:helix-turn-helix domain-containing protein [Geobacillus sp. E263]|uniref:helix-turn-helix domain-containing protein n=1 Tax=Geobacillus sp. E263 TaxID=391290 RepID=UPI002570873E|nr:helix-turn-helix domain-containing protein [Geobacillus sp. E263]